METFNKKYLVITTLLCFAIPPIGIDIYLPSLPALKQFFDASQFNVQLTVTMYLVAVGLSQLFLGALADNFGRRIILLIGFSLALIGTLFCLISPTIQMFILARFLQGIGMACAFPVANAILTDCYRDKKLAKMISLSSGIYSISPILAPVVGGVLQRLFSWKASFIFFGILVLLLLVLVYLFVPETLNKKHGTSFKLTPFLYSYIKILCNTKMVGYIACLIFSYGIIITFNIISPFLFESKFHIKPLKYSVLVVFIGLAYFAGTMINAKLISKVAIKKMIYLGIIITIFGSSALLFCMENISPYLVLTLSSMIIFGTGFIFPNIFATALTLFQTQSGTCSALIGSLVLFGTSTISLLSAKLKSDLVSSLSYMFLFQSLFILIIFTIIYRFSHNRSKNII